MDKFPDPSVDPYHYGAGFRRRKRTSLLCSCVVATLFLLVAAAALAAVFFTVFRPRDPGIQVTAVRLPSYGASSGGEGNGTVRFTFEQLAAVRNPNRATFSHYDSSLILSYGGAQVGFMFIPAGEIGGGRTQYMAASFSVDSIQSAVADDGSGGGGGKMELQSRMLVRGRVRVLPFLMHHVETTATCRVVVAVRDGSVVDFHC